MMLIAAGNNVCNILGGYQPPASRMWNLPFFFFPAALTLSLLFQPDRFIPIHSTFDHARYITTTTFDRGQTGFGRQGDAVAHVTITHGNRRQCGEYQQRKAGQYQKDDEDIR